MGKKHKSHPNQKTSEKQPALQLQQASLQRTWIIVGLILVVTFIAYFPSLNNNLLKTWDDQAYVTNNDLVKSVSFENIKRIFKEDRGLYANYHPLTTLSLAVNYHFSKLSPTGYHLANLLLHLLNTLLVFVFIYSLTNKRIETAAAVCLLFGLHPMHVESVAWISERKDVLYTFFFLGSLVAYQHYVKNNNLKIYILVLLLFFCSLLSKAMAASLPLVLLLVDYVTKRPWNRRIILEKIPFVALAVILGIYAMQIQKAGGASNGDLFSFGNRLLHACYSFMGYIVKIIFPSGLSAFYPYPYPLVNSAWVMDSVPSVLYLTLLSTVAILAFLVINFLKPKKFSRPLIFGLLFYFATVALVLQFIPVGRAIMADRYAYIPSIGILFIVGEVFAHFFDNKKYKMLAITVLTGYAGFLFYQTYQRNKVWKNDEILWTDVIDKYEGDDRVTLAILNRADYYFNENNFAKAAQDYTTVTGYNPKDDNLLDKTGKIYGQRLNDLNTAISFFLKAYKANPHNVEVSRDLGTAYGIKGDFNNSLVYLLKALELNSNDPGLYQNIGITYQNLGQGEKAKEYFAKAGQK